MTDKYPLYNKTKGIESYPLNSIVKIKSKGGHRYAKIVEGKFGRNGKVRKHLRFIASPEK